MLHHSCGYYIANEGYDLPLSQDFLNHRDPKHAMRCTRAAARRFDEPSKQTAGRTLADQTWRDRSNFD